MTERPSANKDVIEDLARQTAMPVQLVRDLYDEEVIWRKLAILWMFGSYRFQISSGLRIGPRHPGQQMSDDKRDGA